MVSAFTTTEETLTKESQHENAIVAYSQLVCILKVIPGHKVLILQKTV